MSPTYYARGAFIYWPSRDSCRLRGLLCGPLIGDMNAALLFLKFRPSPAETVQLRVGVQIGSPIPMQPSTVVDRRIVA